MDGHPRHIVGVGGLVSGGAGRVLLVRAPFRGWHLPGGQVERGEDLLAALAREIAEESGCRAMVGRLVGVYSNVGDIGIVQLTFLCAHAGGDPCGGHECSDAGWFAPEEAARLVIHPVFASILRDALAARAAPAPREIVYRAFCRIPEQPVPPGRDALPDGRPARQRTGYYAVRREHRC